MIPRRSDEEQVRTRLIAELRRVQASHARIPELEDAALNFGGPYTIRGIDVLWI
jgi:hypothetical protein